MPDSAVARLVDLGDKAKNEGSLYQIRGSHCPKGLRHYSTEIAPECHDLPGQPLHVDEVGDECHVDFGITGPCRGLFGVPDPHGQYAHWRSNVGKPGHPHDLETACGIQFIADGCMLKRPCGCTSYGGDIEVALFAGTHLRILAVAKFSRPLESGKRHYAAKFDCTADMIGPSSHSTQAGFSNGQATAP
jgi:hypothetical protein